MKSGISDELAAQAAEEMLGKSGAMPPSVKEANGGLSTEGQPLDKAVDAEEEEDEEEEGGEDMEKKCKKSEAETVDADALVKAMDALDAAAAGINEAELDRRAELAKSLSEGTLSDEERQELLGLLGGTEEMVKSEGGGSVSDALSSEFAEDYDVSPFLEKFGAAIGSSIDVMRDEISKSASGQQAFNQALAKSMRGVADVVRSQEAMIKSLVEQNEALSGRLEAVESRPRMRKSLANPGQAKPLQKSFAGQAPQEGLTKSQAFEGLHRLMIKNAANGGLTRGGQPIDRIVARLEAGENGVIDRNLMAEIKEVLQ